MKPPLQEYLRDWLVSSTRCFSVPSVRFARDLTLSPYDRAQRRRASKAAVWVVLERSGEFFLLAGMAPLRRRGLDGYHTIEVNALNGVASGFWLRDGPGEWRFVDGTQGPLV